MVAGQGALHTPTSRSLPALARAALWLIASALLLLAGFALVTFGLYRLAIATGAVSAENLRSFQIGMAFYFRVVFFQGLLPGLVLALALWPAAVRLVPRFTASRSWMLGGLVLCSSLAYALVGPFLLTARIAGEPAMKIEGTPDQVGSALLVVGAVALCAFLPRAFLPGLRASAPDRADAPTR